MNTSSRDGGIARLSRAAGLFAQGQFLLFWSGETVSSFGSSISAFAIPLTAITLLKATPFEIGLLGAAPWIPWLFIALPAGAIVDRVGRRTIMIVADTVSFLSFGSIAFAGAMGLLTFTQLGIAATVGGTAKVFFSSAYRAYIADLLPSKDLLEGNSKLQGGEQTANALGPALAGAIAQLFGAISGVLIDAATFVVSGLCLLALGSRGPSRTTVGKALHLDIREGLRLVIQDQLLWSNAIYGCIANFAVVGFSTLSVLFLVKHVGLGSGLAGLLVGLSAVGGVVGAVSARPLAKKIGLARTLLVFRVGLVPLVLLIPLTGPGFGLLFYVVGSVAMSSGGIGGNIIWSTVMQGLYPAALLGRISAPLQLLNYSAIPLGAICAGSFADVFGIRNAIWIMLGALVGASAILIIGPVRRARNLALSELE